MARFRDWLPVAALLAILALGLPVASWEIDGYLTAGTYLPGSCVTTYGYDGYPSLDCTSGTYQAGYYLPGSSGSYTALDSGLRVFLVATISLAVFAIRRRSPRAGNAALLVGVIGLARYAAPVQPGIVALALALLALASGLHTRGLVRLPAVGRN